MITIFFSLFLEWRQPYHLKQFLDFLNTYPKKVIKKTFRMAKFEKEKLNIEVIQRKEWNLGG